MNLVSVRLLLFETGVGNAVRHLEKFGFSDATLIRNGSLALGGGQASPLDMAQGYAIIANGGHAVTPYVIDSIHSATGEPLFRAEPAVVCVECTPDKNVTRAVATDEQLPTATEIELEQMAEIVETYRPDATIAPELFAGLNLAPQAITPQNAFIVQDMMRSVVGLAEQVHARGANSAALTCRVKPEPRMIDVTPGLADSMPTSLLWFGVGYDDDLPLGPREEGSRTALPIWIEFARIALEGAPEHKLPMPDGITSIKIDRATGCRARSGQLNTTFEVFRVGHEPNCDEFNEIIDPFNDAAGTDPEPDPENEEEAAESLF